MDKEQTRRAAEVMLAWASGETIEWKLQSGTKWEATTNKDSRISWDWLTWEYRIKPKEDCVFLGKDWPFSACSQIRGELERLGYTDVREYHRVK